LAYTSGSFNGSADVTGTGTLATVNSNVGSFTNASITVNAKGLITAASSGSGGGITRGTSVSASGTSVSFTSLPSTIKRISLLFSGVSTNGSSAFLVQLGTGGTATTSGYVCASGRVFFSTNVQTSTAGFILNYDNAAYAVQGSLSFENISGNTWVASGTVSSTASTPLAILMGGTVTLSGVLDMIRLTTVNGTDSYDAGTLNILYQ
jgi:hypothetical protein